MTCTISYKCPGARREVKVPMASNGPGSSASDCDQTIQGLTEITSRQAGSLEGLRAAW